MTGPQTNMTRSTQNKWIKYFTVYLIRYKIQFFGSCPTLSWKVAWQKYLEAKSIFVCFTISTTSSVDHLSHRSHNIGLKDDCDQIYKSMTDKRMMARQTKIKIIKYFCCSVLLQRLVLFQQHKSMYKSWLCSSIKIELAGGGVSVYFYVIKFRKFLNFLMR